MRPSPIFTSIKLDINMHTRQSGDSVYMGIRQNRRRGAKRGLVPPCNALVPTDCGMRVRKVVVADAALVYTPLASPLTTNP